MKPLTEATEEEIRLAKIKAIRNLIGESADQFDLDSMSDENLDNLFAELDKASIQESNKAVSQELISNLAAIYKLQEKQGFKRDEAEIVLKDTLNESKKK